MFKNWNYWHNPLYHWWKVRKSFKRPRIQFICGTDIWFYGLPIDRRYYNPILDINFSAVGWKTKYGEPRHEWNPYIQICFFRRFHLIWTFEWKTANMATWEALLDHLYRNIPIEECIRNHTWSTLDGTPITIKSNLKL